MVRTASLAFALVTACGSASAPLDPPAAAPIEPPRAAPEPDAATGPGGAPCFDGPPLVASTVYRDLERYSSSPDFWDGRSPMPRRQYGSCTVEEAVIRRADGREVAQLTCGIRVQEPGLLDHLGLQVGAPGRQVIERSPKAADRLVCVAAGDRGHCWVRPQYDAGEPVARYTVLGAPESELLEGAAAVDYFAPRAIESFRMTIYCH